MDFFDEDYKIANVYIKIDLKIFLEELTKIKQRNEDQVVEQISLKYRNY